MVNEQSKHSFAQAKPFYDVKPSLNSEDGPDEQQDVDKNVQPAHDSNPVGGSSCSHVNELHPPATAKPPRSSCHNGPAAAGATVTAKAAVLPAPPACEEEAPKKAGSRSRRKRAVADETSREEAAGEGGFGTGLGEGGRKNLQRMEKPRGPAAAATSPISKSEGEVVLPAAVAPEVTAAAAVKERGGSRSGHKHAAGKDTSGAEAVTEEAGHAEVAGGGKRKRQQVEKPSKETAPQAASKPTEAAAAAGVTLRGRRGRGMQAVAAGTS